MICWFCRAPMSEGNQLRSFDGILRVVPAEWGEGDPLAGPHRCNEFPPSPAELVAAGLACLDRIQQLGLEALFEMSPAEPVKKRVWLGWI